MNDNLYKALEHSLTEMDKPRLVLERVNGAIQVSKLTPRPWKYALFTGGVLMIGATAVKFHNNQESLTRATSTAAKKVEEQEKKIEELERRHNEKIEEQARRHNEQMRDMERRHHEEMRKLESKGSCVVQ
jgi:uncharacterized protein HemX